MPKRVASIIKYDNYERVLEWLNKLPTKYPEWKIEKAEQGDYILWSSEVGGILIIKDE